MLLLLLLLLQAGTWVSETLQGARTDIVGCGIPAAAAAAVHKQLVASCIGCYLQGSEFPATLQTAAHTTTGRAQVEIWPAFFYSPHFQPAASSTCHSPALPLSAHFDTCVSLAPMLLQQLSHLCLQQLLLSAALRSCCQHPTFHSFVS
jgi:hypothetical protein